MKKLAILFFLLIINSVSGQQAGLEELEYQETKPMNWVIRRSSFEVEQKLVIIKAIKNNETRIFINITNDGVESFPDVVVAIDGNITGKIKKAFTTLPLPKKSAKSLQFNVLSDEDGLFTGNITFKTENINKTVPIVLGVSESDKAEVNVTLLNDVKAGKNLDTLIYINTGFVNQIGLNVTYGISDIYGGVIGERKVEAQVRMETNATLNIPVPNSVGVGDYYFYVILDLNGKKYVEVVYFNISTILSVETIIISGFVLIIIAIVLGSVVRKKPKTISEYEKTIK